MKKREFRLLFLATLSQCLIDNIDEGIGEFKKADRSFAKTFFDRLMAIMNKDFGSPMAVEQLVELTVWLEDMFYVMMQVGEFGDEQTKQVQDDWKAFMEKYDLVSLKR